MGLGLLFISLNHYFHFLLNIKEYDVKFFHVSLGSTTSIYKADAGQCHKNNSYIKNLVQP